jgi:lysyl-tRNA synthetase class 2
MADWHPERLAARLPFLQARAKLTAATRAWLTGRGYAEVETPCLVPSPGAEVHLRGFPTAYRAHHGQGRTRELWLRSSPEMALKRLLAGGAGPVFELARVWRNGEIGDRHAPEFTMLEWYRPGLPLAGLMDEAEALLRDLCPPRVTFGGVETDLGQPFDRITCAEAFTRWVGVDLLGSIRPDGAGEAVALGATPASPGKIASSASCSITSSRIWAATARPSSPTGPLRRPHSPVATRPTGGWRCASNSSPAASSWPTPSRS